MADCVPIIQIEKKILVIRDKKIMIDRDLSDLYGVSTKRLNEQVKRNIHRFPEDFLFTLTIEEKNELVANCDRFRTLKHSSANPYAFTENGVAMLSSVLNSDRAIEVNIQIMRAFTRFREYLSTHQALAEKFRELEERIGQHDQSIQAIIQTIQSMLDGPAKRIRKIGFNRS